MNSIRSPETRCQFSITRMLPSLETRLMISRALVRASAIGNVNVVDAVLSTFDLLDREVSCGDPPPQQWWMRRVVKVKGLEASFPR